MFSKVFPHLLARTPNRPGNVRCTLEHRYATGLDPGTSPAAGSSLDGLLNRTALMDVPFRGTQRQELMYLAALDNPALPDDPNSTAVLQAYPAYDMLEAGFATFNEVTSIKTSLGLGLGLQ